MVRNQFKVVVSSDVPSLVGLGKSRFVGYTEVIHINRDSERGLFVLHATFRRRIFRRFRAASNF
jgi:hypothetical protein